MAEYFQITNFSKINNIYKFQIGQITIMQQRCIEIVSFCLHISQFSSKKLLHLYLKENKRKILKQNYEQRMELLMKLNQAITALIGEIKHNRNKLKYSQTCQSKESSVFNRQINPFMIPSKPTTTILEPSFFTPK